MTWNKNAEGQPAIPLEAEHLLLGALMGCLEEEGMAVPLSYGNEAGEYSSLKDGCGLADLSGLYCARIGGAPAAAFAEAAFAGKKLDVGECAFEPAFMGDGRVCSIPLIARTGDEEYVLWDATASADMLCAWLSFLANIEQDGYRPYEGLELEDASESLVPLVLWGGPASAIIRDYVDADEKLPQEGHIKDVALDGHIPSLVASVRLDGKPCLLLLVDPHYAQIVWRSLLSFKTVTPTGQRALRTLATQSLPWLASLDEAMPHAMDADELSSAGLIRASHDFIGARALAQ